ncbi:hypothetical protein A3860_29970 [Niastella vici]|uniref:DUF218 domain-containing protein n=2 Tax=Niastella vici TaxID=1703345 RepID=A0A1V9FU89_9BACT|nr:hypothetical protein A3860_29970 [Niastella vici]
MGQYIRNSKPLDAIRARLQRDALDGIKNCETASCFGSSLQFTGAEIKTIGDELVRLSLTRYECRKWVDSFKIVCPYVLFKGEDDTAFVRKAWETEVRGLNNILGVYIEGRAPLYPKIDAISFQNDDPAFRDSIAAGVHVILDKYGKYMNCFTLPVRLAVEAMRLNGRNEAIRYERDYISFYNDYVGGKAKEIKWDSFPYSVILVPGLGPEQPGVKLDPGGARRCDSAAVRFRAGLAPFIVVSGGHVHPNKTPYCEANEMVNYLIDVCHIPMDNLIVEPYARHTTTNLRNTNRIIFNENIPPGKPVLIVTDAAQTNYINGPMKEKVVKELGYTPFSSMKKLSATETEYLPTENSRQVNSMDPLDP